MTGLLHLYSNWKNWKVFSSVWERASRLKLWSFFTACRSSSLITLRNSFQSLLTSPHWKEKIKWQFCFFRVPRISISYRSRYFKREKFVSFWKTETETWALISVKVKKGCNFLPARSLFYCYLHEQALQILIVIERLNIDHIVWAQNICLKFEGCDLGTYFLYARNCTS